MMIPYTNASIRIETTFCTKNIKLYFSCHWSIFDAVRIDANGTTQYM